MKPATHLLGIGLLLCVAIAGCRDGSTPTTATFNNVVWEDYFDPNVAPGDIRLTRFDMTYYLGMVQSPKPVKSYAGYHLTDPDLLDRTYDAMIECRPSNDAYPSVQRDRRVPISYACEFSDGATLTSNGTLHISEDHFFVELNIPDGPAFQGGISTLFLLQDCLPEVEIAKASAAFADDHAWDGPPDLIDPE